MRLTYDAADGTATAVCLYCDREMAADPHRCFHCYCRSDGPIVGHALNRADSARAV